MADRRDIILLICSIIKSLCAPDYTLVFIWMEIQIQQVNGVEWCFSILFMYVLVGTAQLSCKTGYTRLYEVSV